MFVDYYAILEINSSASQEEIKIAFKQQALKWHPDRNPSQDTTLRMQQINEAYLILKDSDARLRYDIEYKKFKQYQKQQDYSNLERDREQDEDRKNREWNKKQYERDYDFSEYSIDDDILKKWMESARKQAVDLAKKTIEDFKGISTAGARAVTNEAVAGIGRYLIVSVIIMIIFAIVKSCNG